MWREYLIAVRDRVRSQRSYDYKTCELMFDGKPPPRCGEVFVSVCQASRSSSSDLALVEDSELLIVLTIRAERVPFDRWGTDLMNKATTGFNPRIDALRALCHMDYTAMNTANTALGGLVNGWVSPLMYVGEGRPTVQGPDWFHAEPSAPEVGVSMELRFGKSERIQIIEMQS